MKANKYSTLRRTVDALVESTDEGRNWRAIRLGELPRSFDPKISEWGNPPPLAELTPEYIGCVEGTR